MFLLHFSLEAHIERNLDTGISHPFLRTPGGLLCGVAKAAESGGADLGFSRRLGLSLIPS